MAYLLSACAALQPVGDEPADQPLGTSVPVSQPEGPVAGPVRVLVPKLAQPDLPDARADGVPPGLWDVIRDGLALQELAQHDRVSVKRERYMRGTALLLNVDRARYYLPFVVEEVQRRELPLELALLPFIESTLDPYAFSHGGAAGLWQLIPATASRFGVEMNWWYDGRRDLVDSTSAALDYLEYLHGLFDDWLLAIAAYNAGEGRIRRALTAAGAGTSYWDLSVPAETARYVPRLLALSQLVAAPDRYGVTLAPLEPAPRFAASHVDAQIDLTALAVSADIPADEIFRFNPGLNHGATPPTVPHRLLIPTRYLDQFEAALARHPGQATKWTQYTVERGDTLGGIAQRFGTSVAAIREANAINGHLIRNGQGLLIPGAGMAANHVPGNPLLQTRRATTEYRVAAGDSLWTISRRFSTTVDTLVRVNRLNPRAPLRIGQRLAIPTTSETPSDRAVRRIDYRVRGGDSLARIASRFNVTVRDLVRWNRLDPSDYLQPGQRLTIMVDIRSSWS